MELRGEEGETVNRCGVELGAVAPWRARLGRRGKVANGRWPRCLLCFGVEGGRRGRLGRVGQKAEQADGAARPSWSGIQ
jgi:hypothetical protein